MGFENLVGKTVKRIDGKDAKVVAVAGPLVKIEMNGETVSVGEETFREDFEIPAEIPAGPGAPEAAASKLLARLEGARGVLEASEKAKALKRKKKKAKGGGGKSHSPFKRLAALGTTTTKKFGPPPKGTRKVKTKNDWSCTKTDKYTQVCTAQSDIKDKAGNIVAKKGTKKTVRIDPGYKSGYNAAYSKATAAGGTHAFKGK